MDLKPYAVYELTYNPIRKLGRKWYIERENFDNYERPQILHKAFLDIEVFGKFEYLFPEPKEAKYPISSVSLCFSNSDTYYLFVNIAEYKQYGGDINKLKDIEINITEKLFEHYKTMFNETEFKNFKLKVFICNNEKDLLRKLFDTIHQYDPVIIAGFNSTNFDFPYIYNRLIRLGEKPEHYMTKFNEIDYIGYEIDTPDYKYIDLRYLYAPNDGMGFGDSLESYSLNAVAEHELGFRKVEYDEDNLDELYINDIEQFLFYNLIDTILLKKLDQKLKHIEMYNSLRRMSRSLFHIGYKGRSFLGEDLIRFLLYKEENEVARDYLPETKIPFTSERDKFKAYYLSLKNFGAYVKKPPNDIFRGLIVDYDQTSMYPSLDVMFNIDYTTLRAKVYPLFTSVFIKHILSRLYEYYINDLTKFNKSLQKVEELWLQLCDLFSEKYSPPNNNKAEFRKYNTYFTTKLILAIFKKAKEYGYNNIIEYIQNADYFTTLAYIYPLFENITHVLSVIETEINPVAYFYLTTKDTEEYLKYLKYFYTQFNSNEKITKIIPAKLFKTLIDDLVKKSETFIILEPVNNTAKFELISIPDLIDSYFHEYIITPTGTLFNKHEDKLSIQAKFILTFMKLRKQVQQQAAEKFEQGLYELSEELERTQLAIKILLNSIAYGISILPSYVFNDKNIANTITISGRFMIKFAQYWVDKLISTMIDNK